MSSAPLPNTRCNTQIAHPPPPWSGSADATLWAAIGAHLDEAAAAFGQWRTAMDAPDVGLQAVADGPERRLFRHLHELWVGGRPVFDRVLAPLLRDPRMADPDRLSVAVMGAIMMGRPRQALAPVLWDWGAQARSATLRACAAVDDPNVARWVRETLPSGASPDQQAWMFELGATHHLPVDWVLAALRGEHPGQLAAATRALRWADGKVCPSAVNHLLGHERPDVRDEALVTALHLGSRGAWAWCRELAQSRTHCTHRVLELVALLGRPRDHQLITQALEWPEHRRAATWALGLTGNVAVVDTLLDLVEAGTTREPDAGACAPLASEALSLITGLDLGLDLADGAGARERWCRHRRRFSNDRRYVAGLEPYPHGYLNQLRKGRMRHRHAFALLVSVRTRGQALVQTRARTTIQRAQVEGVARTHAPRLSAAWQGW